VKLPDISDPLEWALSLPVSDKFTRVGMAQPSLSAEMPVPPEHEGWTFFVSRQGTLFKVAARHGSLIVIRPKLTFEEVERFNPREGRS
jgi:hypothetical protein